MRIAIGCDHRGLNLKRQVMESLAKLGHQCEDMGCHSSESVDYPDLALEVARAVSQGRAERGILICSTGIGMSMVANRVPGVRAARCQDTFSAGRSRLHNDANVLCLGADIVGEGLALDIIGTFLNTDFEGGRHQRRLEKLRALDGEGR
jgi:ribose 5-phosphate isomerase B